MLLFTETEDATVRAAIKGVWVGGGRANIKWFVEDFVSEDRSGVGRGVSAREEGVGDVSGWDF